MNKRQEKQLEQLKGQREVAQSNLDRELSGRNNAVAVRILRRIVLVLNDQIAWVESGNDIKNFDANPAKYFAAVC